MSKSVWKGIYGARPINGQTRRATCRSGLSRVIQTKSAPSIVKLKKCPFCGETITKKGLSKHLTGSSKCQKAFKAACN